LLLKKKKQREQFYGPSTPDFEKIKVQLTPAKITQRSKEEKLRAMLDIPQEGERRETNLRRKKKKKPRQEVFLQGRHIILEACNSSTN